jgi:NADP-reducing hydrogenase subunit HndB
MVQIKSLSDLQALKKSAHERMDTRIKGKRDDLAQVKVAMATCGITAGAKSVFDYMLKQADEKGLEIILTQSDCMGHCNAEPTIEVTLPGKEPVVFGNVDNAKADEILDKYIAKGELVDGVIAK